MTNTESKKEIWRVPMCTRSEVMEDKSFPYKLYSKMTLESNHTDGENHRYIKNSKMRTEEFTEELKAIGISESTFKRQISKLKKHKAKIIQLVELNDGVAYRIKYEDSNNRNYITVNSDKLRLIINSCNDTCIKIYMILLYTCNYETETQVTQEWLLSKLGLSATSRQIITDCLTMLDNKVISVRSFTERTQTINKNGNITSLDKKKNFIKLLK